MGWSVPSCLSADGKTILFQESGEGGGPKYAVYLRNTDGSPAIRLGEGSGLSLSPDGKWALSRLNVTPSPLVLYPTGVGEMKRLKDDGINHVSMGFLPDAKRFVFTGTDPGHGVRRESIRLGGCCCRRMARHTSTATTGRCRICIWCRD